MGFGQGLSGLNAAAQDLDVIGNNIANSGTVGFKSGSATFADVYANSRVGLGVQVSGINQDFSIGSVTGTGNQFDIAIDGANGLFRLQDPSGQVLYSRNGQFHADKDNYVVNAQGQRLTGYPAGGSATDLQPIKVPVGNISPTATSTTTTQANLDANAAVIDPAITPFSPAVSGSYTHVLPITVYDSLGNQHQLTQYFAKRAPTAGPPAQSQWDVYYRLDGATITSPADGATKMLFDDSGRLTSAPPVVNLSIAAPGGAGSPAAALAIAVDYTGTTQFGGAFAANFTPNGYASGEYSSMSIGTDGSIVASYTNGQTQSLGSLALANFNNLQGLQPVGGNAWIETSASGQAILGRPGSNGLASIKGQSVEGSNVDMSKELVNMIIAQRTYQANAQTIKTQDQIMQTLITGL
ncbi:flagellar hook protein FlgE [Paralcaligenes ginsengisoli]